MTVRVMRLGRTSYGEAQVAQRGGGERDDGVQPVDLLAQVHRQRLRGPAWQRLQPLAHRLLVKQRRHLRMIEQLGLLMCSCMQLIWLCRPRCWHAVLTGLFVKTGSIKRTYGACIGIAAGFLYMV